MAVAFDTLEYVNALKAADVPDKQAEAQAKALRSALDATVESYSAVLATKTDLVHMENKITMRTGAMLAVAIGVLLAVLPLLIGK